MPVINNGLRSDGDGGASQVFGEHEELAIIPDDLHQPVTVKSVGGYFEHSARWDGNGLVAIKSGKHGDQGDIQTMETEQ